jgi:hydrogenase maturation protease
LTELKLPEEVRVVDFGIRSLDLTYAILDGYDAVILIDAAPRGEQPGTLYVIEPHANEAPIVHLDGHGMDVVKVLDSVAAMGGTIGTVLLVGCEPTPREPDADWGMSLSAPVQAAIEPAVELVESLVEKILTGGRHEYADVSGVAGNESVGQRF